MNLSEQQNESIGITTRNGWEENIKKIEKDNLNEWGKSPTVMDISKILGSCIVAINNVWEMGDGNLGWFVSYNSEKYKILQQRCRGKLYATTGQLYKKIF